MQKVQKKQKREDLSVFAQAGTCVLPAKAVQRRKKDFSKKKQAGQKREKECQRCLKKLDCGRKVERKKQRSFYKIVLRTI